MAAGYAAAAARLLQLRTRPRTAERTLEAAGRGSRPAEAARPDTRQAGTTAQHSTAQHQPGRGAAMQRTDTPQAASTPGEAWRGCVRDPPLDVSLAAVVLVCVAVSLLALRIPLLHRRWLWPPAREYRHTAQDSSSSAARKYVESRIELFGDERSHWFLACLIMYLACGELVSVPVVDGLLQKAFGELWLSKAKCGAGLHALSTVYRLVGRGRQLQATGQPGGWAKWGLEDNPVGMATGLATSAYGVYEFVHRCALIYARWLNQQEAKFHTKGGIELADESIDPDYPAAAAAFRRALTFGRSAQLDEEQYRDIQIRVSRAEFNAAGFGDRVNFSLNSLDDHGKFQLRTLAELDVKALFPSPYIYEHVLPLAKQTVKGGEHYPFVQISLPGSASQQVRELKKQPDLWGPETEGLRQQQGLRTLLGQLVMSEIDTNRDGEVDRQEAEKYVQAEEELRSQVVKKLRDQLVNVISKDFSSGHVSEDIGSKQLKEEYVFGVRLDLPRAVAMCHQRG
jgi:hypothetical protein